MRGGKTKRSSMSSMHLLAAHRLVFLLDQLPLHWPEGRSAGNIKSTLGHSAFNLSFELSVAHPDRPNKPLPRTTDTADINHDYHIYNFVITLPRFFFLSLPTQGHKKTAVQELAGLSVLLSGSPTSCFPVLMPWSVYLKGITQI